VRRRRPSVRAERDEMDGCFRELEARRHLLIEDLSRQWSAMETPTTTPHLWAVVPAGLDDEAPSLDTLGLASAPCHSKRLTAAIRTLFHSRWTQRDSVSIQPVGGMALIDDPLVIGKLNRLN
jgi:hypothetical protein